VQLTAGSVRAKSAKSVCLKNVMDVMFGGAAYFLLGERMNALRVSPILGGAKNFTYKAALPPISGARFLDNVNTSVSGANSAGLQGQQFVHWNHNPYAMRRRACLM
jgi:hypothetical protein